MEYYLVIKKKWNNAIGSNMNEPRDHCTKLCKSGKERQTPYITYRWNLNYDTNNLICETETDLQAKETNTLFSRGKGGRRVGVRG